MKQLTSLIIIILVCSPAFGQNNNFIFKSGFEGSSRLIQYNLNGNFNPDYADIIGYDHGFDWINDLDKNPNFGNFRIYYEKGDSLKAFARIEHGPVDSLNKVLFFKIIKPHISYVSGNGDTLQKGRIQATLRDNVNFKNFYFRQKLYIHPDFALLKTSAKAITWLTLHEFWNNESKRQYPFRVTLNIQKKSGQGSELYFGAHGQYKAKNGVWVSKWESLNTGIAVPIGEWFTLETHFIEGDSVNGLYSLTLYDKKNIAHELFNISDYTCHPDDPAPDGVTSFNPMKLYTSAELIEGMESQHACLCLYWDDFEVWTDSSATFIRRISENDNERLFYPNPVSSVLYFRQNQDFISVAVYTITGELCYTSGRGSQKSIDVSFLPKGLYWVRLITSDQKANSFIFQKE